jgi:hypothetical protein
MLRKPESHAFSYFLFETRSLPALTRSYPRHFTFYVARPAPLHSSFLLFPSHFFLFPLCLETKSRQGISAPRRLLKSNLLVCY